MTARRLGRGLSALIRETTDETAGPDSILRIPVNLITPNPHQPRQEFDKKGLQELASSIKEKGIIQPVTVRLRDGGYELIAGERRWRAAKAAGLTEIPAHVLQIEDDAEMMEYALIENIQRENLNIIEEAEAYAILSGEFRLSHAEIAKAVGKSRVTISNTLRLLKLPPEIKISLRKEELTAGHARALLALKDAKDMLRVWRWVVKNRQSVRATEELVAKLIAPSKGQPGERTVAARKSAEIRRIEDDLIALLGTKVTIREKSKGGVIEVVYYSNDDLERLMDLFSEIEP